MKQRTWLILAAGLLAPLVCSQAQVTTTPEQGKKSMTAANPSIILETSEGNITAELWPDKAPATVSNILAYADAKFYDGLVFHRVISGFMIQGGGFSTDMRQKATQAPIRNEARADVPNKRGTLAMARTMMPNSATSQFFINLVDNAFLDNRGPGPNEIGYCVFGKVTEGMDVVDRIGKVKTGSAQTPQGPFSDVPQPPVVIKSIRRAN